VPEIVLGRFHLEDSFKLNGLVYWPQLLDGRETASVSEGLEFLRQTYTNKVGYEFMYIEVYLRIVSISLENWISLILAS